MQGILCKQHQNRKKEYFCQDCHILLCSDCIVLEASHKNHSVIPAKEASQECRLSLMNMKDNIDNRLVELSGMRENLLANSRQFSDTAKTDLQILRQITQQVEESIEQRGKGQMEEIKRWEQDIDEFESELKAVEQDINSALRGKDMEVVVRSSELSDRGRSIIGSSRVFQRTLFPRKEEEERPHRPSSARTGTSRIPAPSGKTGQISQKLNGILGGNDNAAFPAYSCVSFKLEGILQQMVKGRVEIGRVQLGQSSFMLYLVVKKTRSTQSEPKNDTNKIDDIEEGTIEYVSGSAPTSSPKRSTARKESTDSWVCVEVVFSTSIDISGGPKQSSAQFFGISSAFAGLTAGITPSTSSSSISGHTNRVSSSQTVISPNSLWSLPFTYTFCLCLEHHSLTHPPFSTTHTFSFSPHSTHSIISMPPTPTLLQTPSPTSSSPLVLPFISLSTLTDSGWLHEGQITGAIGIRWASFRQLALELCWNSPQETTRTRAPRAAPSKEEPGQVKDPKEPSTTRVRTGTTIRTGTGSRPKTSSTTVKNK
ncbi:hypothetical protein BLNAU_11030 [Blattamonas nauphoetae]|uniref:B box-type domain-containing protein n=1 Tax=Blattamonas nauphoetae TaxID=2049346 RepID=A0ABQ9XNR6_9EUKA|nr:hypothetical protein BLNAU_11030 [Blattamonas nauphoetae]